MTTSEQKVLIVDDDDSICMALEMVMEEAGFVSVLASNGQEAIQALTEHDFGVAIVDKNLPGGVSGLDILSHIRKSAPFVKVLLHTGFPSTASAIEALRLGAFDYLPKPTDSELIIEKVKLAWESHSKERERDELFYNYEALFEVVPGIVWFVTDDGEFRRISQQGAALLGYSSSEMVGQLYNRFLDASDEEPAAHWAFKERRTGTRGTRRQIVTMVAKSGARRIFEISSSAAYGPRLADEKPHYQGTLMVGVDITDQVGFLQQLQENSKMEALGRMAGGVAHDFNNALTVILSLSGMLREELTVNEDIGQCLDDIHEAGRRAADLTEQLLLFARRGKDVEPGSVLPQEVVGEVERMLGHVVRADIAIEVNLDEEVGHVRIDATQLHQVLMNLGVNANDAMPDGGVISISAQNVEADAEFASQHPNIAAGSFVQFAVGDTGTGIELDVRQRLFEPFFTTKDPGEGTGLGLAIVYGVVKQCQGHITVYSEPGIGTTFKVYLPRVDADDARAAHHKEQLAGGDESLLVVEDDASVRRSIKRILTRQGYRITEATNGLEALSAWEANGPFDMVVTDIVMPKMGGLELAMHIRERAPTTPILYVSGFNGDLSNRFELLTERAGSLQKPFNERSLVKAVRSLFDS